MNNKELERQVSNQLEYGVIGACDDLIRKLVAEIENLESEAKGLTDMCMTMEALALERGEKIKNLEHHVADVTLLRAKIASEQLAAITQTATLEQHHNGEFKMTIAVVGAVKIADMLLAELAKPKP